MQRRLAAILAADVVGYSKLMGEDQERTLDALRALRKDLFGPIVTGHKGEVVKSMGDGWIVEFASVSDAVNCAIKIQSGLKTHAIIRLRIGIHIGEVVFEEEDIFGDGVNVAARLEALADPGGVLISDTAYHSLDGKAGKLFGGEEILTLKNITRAVTGWHWPEKMASEPLPAEPDTLSLPDKPSIVVLPFNNMSDDPDQEHFADGMTEDLITDLSKLSGLFVVARNSSFTFKGKSVDVREAAKSLGVRYVLEGSVRKMGSNVRINAQLIDAISGGHLWAERYDGTVDNVFELQDDVGENIVAALQVHLKQDEQERFSHVHTSNLEAYELFVRAKATPYPPVPERIKTAREMFEQVIKLDPKFAGGYAGVALTVVMQGFFGHTDPTEIATKALALTRQAIAMDDTFGLSYMTLGQALLLLKRHDEAIAAADDAVARQPNDSDAHAFRGFTLMMSGKPHDAFDSIDQAIRLNPQFISSPYLNFRGIAKFLLEDFDGAIDAFRKNQERQGPVAAPVLSIATASLFAIGETQQAEAMLAQIKTHFPAFRLKNWNFLELPRNPENRRRMRDLLIDAGVPN